MISISNFPEIFDPFCFSLTAAFRSSMQRKNALSLWLFVYSSQKNGMKQKGSLMN